MLKCPHISLLKIIRDQPVVEGRPGESLEPLDFEQLKRDMIEEHGNFISDEDVMSAAMYPKVSGLVSKYSRSVRRKRRIKLPTS